MELRQELKPQLKQQQWMKLQMMQYMKILALPSLELKQFIQNELQENPVLELEEKKEETVEKLETEEEELQVGSEDEESSFNATSERRESTGNILEKAVAEEGSLSEYLLEQLMLEVEDFTKRKIGEFIIGNIDEKGYLGIGVEESSSILKVQKELIEETLKVIQGFDPPGVGARDLKECLLIQLKRFDLGPSQLELLEKIIMFHLEDIAEGKFNKISKALNIREEEIRSANQKIASLNPYPGETYGKSKPKSVVPEIIIREENGIYEAIANNDILPHLHINAMYKKIVAEKEPSTKKYLKDKMNSATLLIKALGQRKNLLRKIAVFFTENQKDFLEKGISFLKPMKMEEMAKIQEVHPSTISRAIADKYIQTPGGVFPFKFFFSPTVSHEGVSQAAIKQRLSEFINNEDKADPLSDSEISAKLKDEGFSINRRTIAKYREAMNIPSTLKRRQ